MSATSGIVTFLTENVEAKYLEWSRRGVHFSIPPQAPSWGGMFCRFVDPDGNTFALAGFDDTTRELDRRRREYAGKLESERRAAQELEIAKQVQMRLFPQRQSAITGLDYAGVCIHERSVGGDYYDLLRAVKESGASRETGRVQDKDRAARLFLATNPTRPYLRCLPAGRRC